ETISTVFVSISPTTRVSSGVPTIASSTSPARGTRSSVSGSTRASSHSTPSVDLSERAKATMRRILGHRGRPAVQPVPRSRWLRGGTCVTALRSPSGPQQDLLRRHVRSGQQRGGDSGGRPDRTARLGGGGGDAQDDDGLVDLTGG